MKIQTPNNDLTVIYLNKYYLKDFDYNDKTSVEKYLKKLIFNLKKNYNFSINGFYNLNIYTNKDYGMIVDINRIDEDFLFNNIIDMKVVFHFNNDFLYEIDDYYLKNQIIYQGNIYFYNNKYYLNIINIDELNLTKLLEFSNIIYNDKIKDILSDGILIKEKD
jgi:hypothetical protein